MSPFVLPLAFVALLFITLVFLNERYGLLRAVDRFSAPSFKYAAYVWLALFLLLLGYAITASSLHPATAKDLENVSFYSLFSLHIILVLFLFGWWLLTGRPRLAEFLSVHRGNNGELVMAGFAIGVAGWVITIVMAVIIGLIISATGLMPKAPEPPPMIAWMAALPIWKKVMIVLSAMTVEEAFFRGWLQKRIGLIASTILFALAHSGFGQPLLLIGVTMISLVIGFAFYRTKNLIPGIIAHGVFDAIQLFVIIPIAFKTVL
jgi:membrane protease YdiL (CAAX protease family)